MARKRPDGDGLVRKRKDGRWEGRIVVGHKEDGSLIYRSVFDKSQKALMDKLHDCIETYRDVELSEDSIPAVPAGCTALVVPPITLVSPCLQFTCRMEIP